MVQYCQQAPKNVELTGAFQCQFSSTSATDFVGGVAVGGAGTIPFGQTQPVSPRGSCPANPNGPVADGTQLTDITSSPGNVGANAATSNNSGGAPAAASSAASTVTSSATGSSSTASATASSGNSGNDDGCDSGDDESSSASPTPTAVNNSGSGAAAAATTSSAASGDSSSSGSFQLQNGQDAQKLNLSFESISASDSCNGTFLAVSSLPGSDVSSQTAPKHASRRTAPPASHSASAASGPSKTAPRPPSALRSRSSPVPARQSHARPRVTLWPGLLRPVRPVASTASRTRGIRTV